MKMNEARKLNNKAVIEEKERLTDPTFEKRKNKEELFKEKKGLQEALQAQGLTKDKATYAFDQAAVAEKISLKKKRKAGAGTFGWDVFNEDSLYNAYFKRTKKFEDGSLLKPKVSAEEGEGQPSEPSAVVDRVQLMADDLEQQLEKRSEFRRQRMFIDGEKDIDYINDRNRVFNQKLERNFGKYASHIKANIESGNAV